MRTFIFLAGVGLLLSGCVAKQEYLKLQDELAGAKDALEKTKSELEGLKPELEAKDAELARRASELEETRSRLAELDEAQKRMEESLRSEIEDKSIRLQKLNDRLTVTFVDKILFDSGSAEIKPKGQEALRKVAESLRQMENHALHVEGHTDDQAIGSATAKKFPSNWELSAARATAVVRFLQDEGQVDPRRLFAVGGSLYHPVGANDTPDGRSQNRRVEIVLTPIFKKAATGK